MLCAEYKNFDKLFLLNTAILVHNLEKASGDNKQNTYILSWNHFWFKFMSKWADGLNHSSKFLSLTFWNNTVYDLVVNDM